MNNKVKFLRGTATEYEASTKDNDTFYYTTDDEKLYLGNKEITGGGVTIDDTLSDTSKNPVQNKVINAALNSKANLSDIPTTLPANGGNADTLEGKNSTDFVQNYKSYISEGSIKDFLLTSNSGCAFVSPDVTDMPIDSYSWWFLRIERPEGSHIVAYATNIGNSAEYRIIYNATSDSWSDWVRCNDGGNADTVDGKHASDFSQVIECAAPTDTKTAIGIPYQTTTYWCTSWTDYPAEAGDGQGMIIAAHYNGDGTVGVNDMWVRQLYITPHMNYKIWQRIIAGTTVGEWSNIADGGNAATVNGYTVNANVPAGFSSIGQNTKDKEYTYSGTIYTGSDTSEIFNDYERSSNLYRWFLFR